MEAARVNVPPSCRLAVVRAVTGTPEGAELRASRRAPFCRDAPSVHVGHIVRNARTSGSDLSASRRCPAARAPTPQCLCRLMAHRCRGEGNAEGPSSIRLRQPGGDSQPPIADLNAIHGAPYRAYPDRLAARHDIVVQVGVAAHHRAQAEVHTMTSAVNERDPRQLPLPPCILRTSRGAPEAHRNGGDGSAR